MADPVIILEYDSSWPRQFERLKERAAQVLLDFAPSIEHVGSTAVPGLAAKPIIDLIIQLTDAAQLPVVIQRLNALGYRHEGDLGVSGREAFAPPATDERHHLYVCLPGSPQLSDQRGFRDYLRSHPEARDRYATLKRQLAEKYRANRAAYTDGKAGFIAAVLARTRARSGRPTELGR